MKKRRELDALVNGKIGRKKPQVRGQHELLRDDSDSSEVEEFSMPDKALLRSKGSFRMCSSCMTGCAFIFLTGCVLAVAGLILVHLKLNGQVLTLQARLNEVQARFKDVPVQIADLIKNQSTLKNKLVELQKTSLTWHEKNITLLGEKIRRLNLSLRSLSKRETTDLNIDLPQRVAEIGSKLDSLDEEVKELRKFEVNSSENFHKIHIDMEALILKMKQMNKTSLSEERQLLLHQLSEKLLHVNLSQSKEFIDIREDQEKLMIELGRLRNVTGSLQTTVDLLRTADSAQFSKVSSDVKLFAQQCDAAIESNNATISVLARQLNSTMLGGATSAFLALDANHDGYLSMDELSKLQGAANAQRLMQFDRDHNKALDRNEFSNGFLATNW